MGSSLCASLYSIELKMALCCVNLYGPYVDKERFWIRLFKMECLKSSKLILGGDLNYSVGFSEIWGVRARVDILSDFFIRKMDGFGLVDLVLTVILSTWSNRRVGCENICKRLDRSLISVDFLECNLHLRQWIGCGGDSDHQPVFLQLLNKDVRPRNVFKFNAN